MSPPVWRCRLWRNRESAVTLLADGPYQVPNLVPLTSVFHTVGTALLLLTCVAALVMSVRAATSTG